jgi:hypothetical protein
MNNIDFIKIIRFFLIIYIMIRFATAEAFCIKHKRCYKAAKKNSIALLPGLSYTNLVPKYYHFNNEPELDLGLMYQREINYRWRFTIIFTKNLNFYIGLGFKF